MRGIATLGTSDESRPNKTFEMRILGRYHRELVDEDACDGGVVGWEAEPCVCGTCDGGADARPGEDATCVEVDGCFVGGCEGDAHGEVGEVEEGLEVDGPGDGVEGLDVVEEGLRGLQGFGVWREEGGGEEHWLMLVLFLVEGIVWACLGVAETGVDEENDFEEVGGAADPGGFLEASEGCWAHGGGVEGFGEDARSGEG